MKEKKLVEYWKEILLIMYERLPQIIINSNKKLKLKTKELNSNDLLFIFSYLKKLKYVDYENITNNNIDHIYTLNANGTKVALEFQKHNDNMKSNIIIMTLTTIIAFGSIAQTFSFLLNQFPNFNLYSNSYNFYILWF